MGGHALSAGYHQVDGDSNCPFLNQGDGSSTYLITDVQINKFASTGERTWLAGYAKLGVPGLKASALYMSGDNQEWERDLRLDYVVQDAAFKGLGFTWRNASLRDNDSTDQDEDRLIVSYSLPCCNAPAGGMGPSFDRSGCRHCRWSRPAPPGLPNGPGRCPTSVANPRTATGVASSCLRILRHQSLPARPLRPVPHFMASSQ